MGGRFFIGEGMPPDIFDRLKLTDVFDRVSLDLFDKVDLDVEDKVIFSDEMRNLIREELASEISKIPIGKIITRVLEREVAKHEKANDSLKASVSKDLTKARSDIKNEVAELKTEIEEFEKKIKEKYAELKNQMLSVPQYQFGGYPLATEAYAASNVTPTRTFDATSTSLDEVASVLGTLIETLKTQKLIA